MSRIPLKVPKPLEWGDAKFTNDTVLYSDWNYVQATSGGVNSVGAGIPIASLSIAWSQSHWSSFKKKVNGTLTDIDHVCTKREVTITGFASLITLDDGSFLQYQMEGADWITAVICNDIINSTDAISSTSWAVVLFRKDYIFIPLETWHLIKQPINIVGEIIGFSLDFGIGKRECFIKARAAAFIISTSIF